MAPLEIQTQDTMKRHIFLLLFALIGMNVMAQYSNTEDFEIKPVDIKGSRVFVDGVKLDKYSAAACFSSVDGVDRSADYLKYRAGYKTGLGTHHWWCCNDSGGLFHVCGRFCRGMDC